MSQISRRNFLKGLGMLSLTLPLLKKVPLPQVEPEPEPEPEVVEVEQEIAEMVEKGYMAIGDMSYVGIIFYPDSLVLGGKSFDFWERDAVLTIVGPGSPKERAHGSWEPLNYPNYTRY